MEENASDILADGVTTHTVAILRVQEGMRKTAVARLNGLETELVGKLLDAGKLSTTKTKKYQRLLKTTQDTIKGAYAEIAANAGKDLDQIAKIELKNTQNLLNTAIGVDIVNGPLITPNQLGAAVQGKVIFGGKFQDWWQKQDQELASKFANQMQSGVLLGESVDEMVRRVRGTKANDFKDGIMSAPKHQAEALVRTSTGTVANQARLDSYAENSDLIKGLQWISTLDSRTTHICKGLDGLQWSFPEMKPVGHNKAFPGPLAHWNCRSTQIPVMRSWDELSGKKLKALGEQDIEAAIQKRLKKEGKSQTFIDTAKKRTRESMDGQVAQDLTFGSWLKKKAMQDPSFPTKILGKGRAELWTSGKMTMTQLTDQQSRPLTLAQLNAAVVGNKIPEETSSFGFSEIESSVKATLAAEGGTAALEAFGTLSAEHKAAAEAVKASLGVESPTKLLEAAQAKLDADAKAQIEALVAHPEGSTVAAKHAKAAMAKGKPLTHADWVEVQQLTALEKAAKQKASTLAKAKKKMLAGGQPTKAQQQAINSLDPEEKEAFSKALWEAKQDEAAKIQAAADKAKLQQAQGEASQELFELKKQHPEKAAKINALAAADDFDPIDGLKNIKAEIEGDAVHKLTSDVLTKQTDKQAMKEVFGVTPENMTFNTIKKKQAQSGKSAQELLDEVQTISAEKAAQSAKSATLSKAKKKFIEGKPFTPAQQAALSSLTDTEQANLLETWGQIKNAEVGAAPAPTPAGAKPMARPESTVIEMRTGPLPTGRPPKGFPDKDPDELIFVERLGGSTGAEKVKDKDGNFFVKKRGASADHLREEFTADQLYQAFGVAVPEAHLYETSTGPVKLAKWVDGKEMGTRPGADVKRRMQEDFAVDALLGNWDVVGLSGDNVKIDTKGRPVRIDNGGSLRFKATGPPKPDGTFTKAPRDLWTMRDATQNGRAADTFGELGFYKISDRIQQMDESVLDKIPMAEDVRATLKGRLREMKKVANRGKAFQGDGWDEKYFDTHAQINVEIRADGLGELIEPTKVTRRGTVWEDQEGRTFGTLRARTGGRSAATPKPSGALPSDVFYVQIETAVKNLNYYALNEGHAGTANSGKIAGALQHKAKLEALAKSGDAAEQQMAQTYLGYLKQIEENTKTPETKLKKIDQVSQYADPKVAGMKAPEPAATDATSLVFKTAERLGLEGAMRKVAQWQSAQSGNSWSELARPAKHFMATNRVTEKRYWGTAQGSSEANVKQVWKNAADAVGGEEKLTKAFTLWHAYTQNVLEDLDFDYNDRERRLVRLVRTENRAAARSQGVTNVKGAIHKMERGANESHSIFAAVTVKGDSDYSTYQAVPHSRVLGTYFQDREPGYGQGGFLGNGENEFTADTNGIPFVMNTNAPASKDATKWKVPLDHIKEVAKAP